jgi:hypothetical protein
VSIMPQDPDSKLDPPTCNAEGARIGVPPDITQIRCQLATGHATRHYGRSGMWWETWGSGADAEPWWLVNH